MLLINNQYKEMFFFTYPARTAYSEDKLKITKNKNKKTAVTVNRSKKEASWERKIEVS